LTIKIQNMIHALGIQDMMTAPGIANIITAVGVVVATITFISALIGSWHDRRQQKSAQAREVLQAIIGDCGRFLHPLSEKSPYPILHTATAISKEFWTRLDKDESRKPKGKDVRNVLNCKDLLLSICVEGWVSSTQIIRMMGIVEELERKATSHYLRGKLLLICQASFLLAGVVSNVCSPETFYEILVEILDPLKFRICPDEDAYVTMNTITVELQTQVCDEFNQKYKKAIKLCLDFIQVASRLFIHIEDKKLVRFAKKRELQLAIPINVNALSYNNVESDDKKRKKMREERIENYEQESSLCSRLDLVKESLCALEKDLSRKEKKDYQLLHDLIKSIEEALGMLSKCNIIQEDKSEIENVAT
jgi:hypothetical protein